MGGSSKLLMLLTSPFPLLYSRSALRLTRHPRITISVFSSFPFSKRRISSSTTRPISPFSTHPNSEHLHTQTARVLREEFHAETIGFSPKVSHPWPEWSKLVENLRGNGYFNSQAGLDGEDALSVFENLSEEFLRSAAACLAFARHRSDLLGSLSRKDIEVVVGNGSPFLFKSSLDSARRMKSFLGGDQNNELEFERAYTVDLMRFLLSYVYDPSVVSDGNNLGNGQLVESSVRNLLNEMADASRAAQEFGLSSPQQFTDGYGQSTRPVRPNIEMKRGDWICPKCSFMNFARNLKCLECNEARPKRQLTGGEWECPQCDFFNYGRNVMCLRCDCKRPGEASFGTVESRSTLGYSNESNLNTGDIPITRTTSQFQGNLGHDGTFLGNNFRSVDRVSPGKNTGNTPMTQSLDRILGRRSSVSEMNYNATTAGVNTTGNERSSFSGSSSSPIRRSDGTKSDYVPFVPLPADMFAKPQKSIEQEQPVTGNTNSAELKSSGAGHGKSGDSFQLSEKPVNQAESKEDKEQAEKSERWFKKVSELHDVTDLTSAISDEDFPEIMPMRKGENRFVVSKKKDRSLTSPLNKRRMAMEQSNSTNFVPFVPFPPDYFAKKDKEPQTGVASTTSETQSAPQKSEEHKIVSPDSEGTRYPPQSADNRQTNENSWNTSFSRTSANESKADYGYTGNSSQRPNDLRTTNEGSWNSSSSSSPNVSSAQQFENTQNTRDSWKGGFTGKSLEGSLVKEPDPLDMSEEAKAERWFRRAAQIKDISELSQIPDEDFPQIMPMRKGVNRFVVSKRKTPLERRLTSPQYRRNLPIVSSEPVKKENNES